MKFLLLLTLILLSSCVTTVNSEFFEIKNIIKNEKSHEENKLNVKLWRVDAILNPRIDINDLNLVFLHETKDSTIIIYNISKDFSVYDSHEKIMAILPQNLKIRLDVKVNQINYRIYGVIDYNCSENDKIKFRNYRDLFIESLTIYLK